MAPIIATLVAVQAFVSSAVTLRQPVTQKGAVAASEKLEPSATPVSKVVELLKGLEKQIEEEGKQEAAEYDKFACFCKEEADKHLYQIEKSEERIKALEASITELGEEITVLNQEIIDLGERITELEGKIKEETEKREKEHKKFKEEDKSLAEAIKRVDYATKVLRDSRDEAAATSLLQKVAGDAIAFAPKASVSLVKILKQEPGKPAAYKYQSSEVIEILMELHDTFSKIKKDLFEAEMEKKSISDKMVLGWSNEKDFKEEDKTEKEELVAEKEKEKATKEKDKVKEEKDKGYDEEFQDELTSQCSARAEEWDQRSKARAGELTALSEAIEVLETGVSENYKANKRLTGLAHVKSSVKKPVSLLQVNDENSAAAARAVRTVVDKLEGAAKTIGSPKLNALAMKAALQEDHFVKVRGLIQDLIDRLEAEALAEADQKSYCDKEIGDAVEKRDDQISEVEKQSAIITEKETLVAEKKEEIAELSQAIADLHKALNEAKELRAEEKLMNEKTVEDAKAGLEAVKEAISILEDYYKNPGFIQVRDDPPKAKYEKFKAKGSDREGNTVGDLAPEMSYEGDYEGKVDSKGGVIGLLQVIQSDFERTVETTETAEKDAQDKFDDFEKETKDDIKAKKDSKDDAEKAIEEAEDDIVTAKDEKEDADKLHETALEELDKLKALCVEGAESYEERAKKREEEIEALKEALEILENFNKEE
jgi:hypothetical protein